MQTTLFPVERSRPAWDRVRAIFNYAEGKEWTIDVCNRLADICEKFLSRDLYHIYLENQIQFDLLVSIVDDYKKIFKYMENERHIEDIKTANTYYAILRSMEESARVTAIKRYKSKAWQTKHIKKLLGENRVYQEILSRWKALPEPARRQFPA